MTTIEITLPDQLAQDAQQAGLLEADLLEDWLRSELRKKNIEKLFEAMDRIQAVNDLPYMSPEEIAEEIAIMRAEKRAAKMS